MVHFSLPYPTRAGAEALTDRGELQAKITPLGQLQPTKGRTSSKREKAAGCPPSFTRTVFSLQALRIPP